MSTIYSDEEFNQVLELAKTEKTISMSLLQRRFTRGYNWASKMMDRLEELHMVEEFSGVRDRKVLSPVPLAKVGCNGCQGGGCPTCSGYGYWLQPIPY